MKNKISVFESFETIIVNTEKINWNIFANGIKIKNFQIKIPKFDLQTNQNIMKIAQLKKILIEINSKYI